MLYDQLLIGTTDLGLLVFTSPSDWDQFIPVGPYLIFLLGWIGLMGAYFLRPLTMLQATDVDRSKGYSFFQDSSG